MPIRSLFFASFVVLITGLLLSEDAQARAGRGRSMGRPSSFNSRRSAPPPSQKAQPNNQDGMRNQPPNPNGGGFMRGIAGGLAGGFLGSMLFSSIGHGAGFGGGQGGGIGLIEIILLGGLAYVGFRWWKNRQQLSYASQNGDYGNSNRSHINAEASPSQRLQIKAFDDVEITPDVASDIFFKIQGAWTRRDLSSVQKLVGSEIEKFLREDLQDLKAKRQINRLENIAVRGAEIADSWVEDGSSYSDVRFTANLLDYTVEEESGRVIEGSDSEPVKFEEIWTFAATQGTSNWQVVGIQQV